MKFADFICREAILSSVSAMDKEGAIREMVQSLLDAGKIEKDQFDSIVKAIMKREELGTTGIGRGLAVPHTKHPSVDRPTGLVAVSPEGVDFASLDGGTVHLFFMLVSPMDRPGDHLKALEYISRQLRNETFCRFLKQAKSAADVLQLLDEADANQFGS